MLPMTPAIMERLCQMTQLEEQMSLHPELAEEARINYPRNTPPMPDRLVMVTRQQRFVAVPPHRHHGVIELMYVVQGTIVHHIDNAEIVMEAGDTLLMNQYTVHSMQAPAQEDIAISILIQPRFFARLYGQIKPNTVLSEFIVELLRQDACWNQYLHFHTSDNLQIHNLLEMLVEMSVCQGDPETSYYQPPDLDPDIMQSLMGLLLVYLSKNLPTLSSTSANNYDEIVRQTVQRYIDERYQTATLQEAAEMLNQSESALSRQIKRITGKTFKELLQLRRFEQAEYLLRSTALPASDIAMAVGYENTSYFYRRFRELYGMSPKEFRQE